MLYMSATPPSIEKAYDDAVAALKALDGQSSDGVGEAIDTVKRTLVTLKGMCGKFEWHRASVTLPPPTVRVLVWRLGVAVMGYRDNYGTWALLDENSDTAKYIESGSIDGPSYWAYVHTPDGSPY